MSIEFDHLLLVSLQWVILKYFYLNFNTKTMFRKTKNSIMQPKGPQDQNPFISRENKFVLFRSRGCSTVCTVRWKTGCQWCLWLYGQGMVIYVTYPCMLNVNNNNKGKRMNKSILFIHSFTKYNDRVIRFLYLFPCQFLSIHLFIFRWNHFKTV